MSLSAFLSLECLTALSNNTCCLENCLLLCKVLTCHYRIYFYFISLLTFWSLLLFEVNYDYFYAKACLSLCDIWKFEFKNSFLLKIYSTPVRVFLYAKWKLFKFLYCFPLFLFLHFSSVADLLTYQRGRLYCSGYTVSFFYFNKLLLDASWR